MKKIILFLFPVVFAGGAFLIYVFFFAKVGKGALQVTSVPQSNVYLNGVLIGKTPLCKCDALHTIQSGTYTIRLVPVNASLPDDFFEQKIQIINAVLTVVDRTFGTGATAQGSVISLIPAETTDTTGISLTSFPTGVHVVLDGNAMGDTPLILKNVTVSDHDVQLIKTGYQNKEIRVHTVKGYTLSVLAFLAIDPDALASPAATTVFQASPSAALQKIVILDTPTGFLRVRSEPSLGGSEVAEVKPGDTYDFVTEQDGWYEIVLSPGKTGWVSTSYAQKQ